jgi:CHAT domain-containing protein/Tfp pilus assembly protein PilF
MRRLLPLLLLAGGGVAVAYQPSTPLTAAGGVRTVDLRGGETHRYSLPLRVGEFVNIAAQQIGVDLDAALLAPDGKTVAHSDLPNDDQGPEAIVAIAASAGDYTLVIRAPDRNAPPGRYEVRVVTVREATPEDRRMVAAERLVDEAYSLRSKPTSVSTVAALQQYGEALAYFRSVNDRYREALTLKEIGFVRVLAGNYRQALEAYRPTLDLFTALDNRPGKASTENNMAGVFDLLGDIQAAMEHFRSALDGYRAGGQHALEANVLNNIGKLYGDLGDWRSAVDYYRQALPLLESGGNRSRQAATLHNLGGAMMFTDLAAAVDYHQQALKLRRAIADRPGEAQSLGSLASAHIIAGKLDVAIDYGQRSLAVYRSIGNRAGEARTLRTLGTAYARRGDTERGVTLLDEAVRADRERGDKREESLALLWKGLAQSPATARDSLRQAAAIAQQLGDSVILGLCERSFARVERDVGNLAEARQHAERAIELTEKVRGNAGGEEARASYLSSALDAYSVYIDILMLQHDPAAALEATERSRARSLLEMLSESGADIREGADPKLLSRERETASLLNAKGARLLLLMGRATPQADALQQEVRALESQYRDIEAEIRKNSPRYAALTQPSPLHLKEIQEDVLDADTLLLEYSLGEKRSYLFAVSRGGVKAWELPPRGAIEELVAEVYGLLTARSATVRMETAAERQKRIDAADAALPEAARKLSAMVLAPAASELAGKRLAIVPDGALQRLPFAMLPVPGADTPLVAEHEIVMLPSASTLAVQRTELAGRKPAAKLVAVFADPLFNVEDAPAAEDATRILEHVAEESAGPGAVALKIPRLPFTAQEADRILRVAGGSKNWKATGYQASRAAAIGGQLSDYRYVHFATHGLLDTERPSLSGLVLAQLDEKKKPQDGFLRVNDIYNLRLSADLVVLSACQTGLGKEVRGEGLMGLTRAFLYAGAPRVVVSLWNVNDRATAELMAGFYRGMLRDGKRPAAALREAQLQLRQQKQWASPYYWAAFVQHGEWK